MFRGGRLPEPGAPGGDGSLLSIMAGLSATLGSVATELRSARQAAERKAGELFYAPVQPILLTAAAAVAGVTTFANAETWGPKTGYFWAIQRMAAFGLAPAGNTLTQSGSATSPATFQTLGTLTGLTPFANYDVTVTALTSGTTGTPELNNFRLASAPFASLVVNSQPGASVTTTAQYQVGAGGNLVVTTGGNTPTTGAVYEFSLDASAVADNLNLYRGQPQVQNFMNNLQEADPEWRPGHTGMILQPGDYVTAQGTGLVGSPIAVNFDAIIGRLDLLPDFLS